MPVEQSSPFPVWVSIPSYETFKPGDLIRVGWLNVLLGYQTLQRLHDEAWGSKAICGDDYYGGGSVGMIVDIQQEVQRPTHVAYKILWEDEVTAWHIRHSNCYSCFSHIADLPNEDPFSQQ